MNTKELEFNFSGIGEVKGFEFTQIDKTVLAYAYEVNDNEGNMHFEVFKRKLTALCIDFEKKQYSETDFKVKYPRSNDFGIWAWTFTSKFKALLKLKEISIEETDANVRILNNN